MVRVEQPFASDQLLPGLCFVFPLEVEVILNVQQTQLGGVSGIISSVDSGESGNILIVHGIMAKLATRETEMRQPFVSKVQPKRGIAILGIHLHLFDLTKVLDSFSQHAFRVPFKSINTPCPPKRGLKCWKVNRGICQNFCNESESAFLYRISRWVFIPIFNNMFCRESTQTRTESG
ncbi:uncharacterized protein LOC104422929 [Eucalyptus grandis]|uniref:uncharacterized protein LOC104422929 n=1 Tax=Eucalyptus grandis TaxID=71139 RepID=UPI00192EC832|nr:uncharacterized protein LOC104422929 [Eucalyptus grandis]XP_039172342.1 uncharacterized protein LOC104422929 [Eucalyptus grandis]XP_039172343.1 uncharacterized protein LOC104422929 [Eucalyptus grandis]XP_039172344.1 uncharacterized protein LOC104422929 [Eucalyptus grandis]XP_039172345.1 uncharacterized protein LOC104422929 [Eucalyptus grandis]